MMSGKQPLNLTNEQAKSILLGQVMQVNSTLIVKIETIISDLINQMASQQAEIERLTKEKAELDARLQKQKPKKE